LPAAGAFASLADHGEIITHTVGRKESGFFCIAFFICFHELEIGRVCAYGHFSTRIGNARATPGA